MHHARDDRRSRLGRNRLQHRIRSRRPCLRASHQASPASRSPAPHRLPASPLHAHSRRNSRSVSAPGSVTVSFAFSSEVISPTCTICVSGIASRTAPNTSYSRDHSNSHTRDLRAARFGEVCLRCSPIAIAAGNSSNTKLIPHGPVIEASCRNGKKLQLRVRKTSRRPMRRRHDCAHTRSSPRPPAAQAARSTPRHARPAPETVALPLQRRYLQSRRYPPTQRPASPASS